MMIPEPDPPPCWLNTLILTTEGSTCFATASTEPTGAEPSVSREVTGLSVAVADEVLFASSSATTPAAPATPAIPPTASAATIRPATTARDGRPVGRAVGAAGDQAAPP